MGKKKKGVTRGIENLLGGGVGSGWEGGWGGGGKTVGGGRGAGGQHGRPTYQKRLVSEAGQCGSQGNRGGEGKALSGLVGGGGGKFPAGTNQERTKAENIPMWETVQIQSQEKKVRGGGPHCLFLTQGRGDPKKGENQEKEIVEESGLVITAAGRCWKCFFPQSRKNQKRGE